MIRKVLLLGLLIGSLISCEPKEKVEPALSPIPHIEFKQIKDFDIRPRDSYWYDSLVTTITYKDGDADLGKEYGSPFKFDGSDYNYVVTLLVKRNGQYQQYIIPGTDQHEIPFLMFQVP